MEQHLELCSRCMGQKILVNPLRLVDTLCPVCLGHGFVMPDRKCVCGRPAFGHPEDGEEAWCSRPSCLTVIKGLRTKVETQKEIEQEDWAQFYQ